MILGDGAELMRAAPATWSSKWRWWGDVVKAELFIIFRQRLTLYMVTLAQQTKIDVELELRKVRNRPKKFFQTLRWFGN